MRDGANDDTRRTPTRLPALHPLREHFHYDRMSCADHRNIYRNGGLSARIDGGSPSSVPAACFVLAVATRVRVRTRRITGASPVATGGVIANSRSEGDRFRREHLVGTVEVHFGLDVHTDLGHPGSETRLSERVEGFFALPCVQVVAILALPPRDV